MKRMLAVVVLGIATAACAGACGGGDGGKDDDAAARDATDRLRDMIDGGTAQPPPECAISGTWLLTETQTGGSCDFGAEAQADATIAQITAAGDGYTFAVVLDDGSAVACVGRVAKATCSGEVSCTLALQDEDGNAIVVDARYLLTFVGATATGSVAVDVAAGDASGGSASCDYLASVAGRRQ